MRYRTAFRLTPTYYGFGWNPAKRKLLYSLSTNQASLYLGQSIPGQATGSVGILLEPGCCRRAEMSTGSLTSHTNPKANINNGAVVLGEVRIQALSSTLVRIELRGPNGFEDRETFTVVHRGLPIAPITVRANDEETRLVYPDFMVILPNHIAGSLDGIQVLDRTENILCEFGKELPGNSYLPGPSEKITAYVMPDSPRIVPPPWGATPQPESNEYRPETSGWVTANDAPDLYVFMPGDGGYRKLREEFLSLTGSVPIPPLWSFGFWDSQWYPYSEQEALDGIDLYRSKGFPLDGFVIDTDWRVNGSDGYNIATKYFPDMKRFLRRAHERGVKLVFNDHPEPAASTALAPEELSYRWKGLTGLLRMGLDAWWFDRNWHTRLHEPLPGLAKEVWGQRLFHDITARFRPRSRPMIMSNVDGIDNGIRNRPPHPASHRFPITWTGDTFAEWRYLEMGIANCVDYGVVALQPYLNEDLGGHHSQPTSELYIRFLQYGAFSPTMRIHCTLNQERHPWSFGEEAESIAKDYILLRYRLLPTLYTAARRAYETGTPPLKRCDLEWPTYRQSSSNQQFLFGEDLLIAPVTESRFGEPTAIATAFLRTPDGRPGLQAEYFAGPTLEGAPFEIRTDLSLDIEACEEPTKLTALKDGYSVRWTGVLGPVPETGEYILSTSSEDRLRFWLDGDLIVDQWIIRTIGEDQTVVRLERGKTYAVAFEHSRRPGSLKMRFAWALPSQSKSMATKSLWLPPGEWRDLWSGKVLVGPQDITIGCPNRKMPMFVRQGSVIAATKDAETAGPIPWTSLILEAFPPSNDGTVGCSVYEDDGSTVDYLEGKCRSTQFQLKKSGTRVTIEGRSEGGSIAKLTECDITVRLHLRKGETAKCNRAITLIPALKSEPKIPLGGPGTSPAPGEGPIAELHLPCQKLSRGFRIVFNIVSG